MTAYEELRVVAVLQTFITQTRTLIPGLGASQWYGSRYPVTHPAGRGGDAAVPHRAVARLRPEGLLLRLPAAQGGENELE